MPTLVAGGVQPPPHEPAGPTIRWGQLVVVLACLAAASLGTLVVVVGIKDVDILSTVALALAVLAFAAQLIVSLAQSQGAARQLAEVERVNSETKAALAEIRATSQSLLSTQSNQFDKVLTVALRTGVSEAVREYAEAEAGQTPGNGTPVVQIDQDELIQRIEDRVQTVLKRQDRRGLDVYGDSLSFKRQQLLATLDSMHSGHRETLLRLARRQPHDPPVLPKDVVNRDPYQSLIFWDLITATPDPEDGNHVTLSLTTAGRQLANTLIHYADI